MTGYAIKLIGKTGGISYLQLGGIPGPKEMAYRYRDEETARQAGAHYQRMWGRANVSYEVEMLDDSRNDIGESHR